MALKIIGAGFPRNGTMSLRAAFDKLGYAPSYHMSDVLVPRPGLSDGHAKVWADIIAGEQNIEWESFLGSYGSCCDFPTSAFYRELAETWPDAKVILTKRDPEQWYNSYTTMIRAVRPLLWAGYIVPHLRDFRRVVEGLHEREFGTQRLNRDTWIRAYERHNEEVVRTIPTDRLLVFDLREGWGPLCEFLGKPTPSEPFPHLNEGKNLAAQCRRVLTGIVTGRWGAARGVLEEMSDNGDNAQ